MRLRFIFGMVMAVLALAACGPTETERRLREADAVMESNPDSALRILGGLDRSSLQSEDLAYYALLKTQGDVKTYVEVDSDSLISIAMEHYADSKDEEKRKRAYFYTAQVAFYRRDYPAAMRAVLPAYEYAKEKKDHYWTAKAAEMMADVFAKTYIYPQEERYRLEAAENYKKSDRIRNHRFALCDLAVSRINDNRSLEGLSLLDSLYRLETHAVKPDSILMESILENACIEFIYGIEGFQTLRKASESYLKYTSPSSDASLQESLLRARHDSQESANGYAKWMRRARLACSDSTEYLEVLYLEYRHAQDRRAYKDMALLGDTILTIQNHLARNILSESMLSAQGQYYQLDSYAKSEELRYSKLRNAFYIMLTLFVISASFGAFFILRKRHNRELEDKINLITLLEKENKTKTEDNEHLRLGLQHQADSFNEAMEQVDRLVSENQKQTEFTGAILRPQWKILNTLCKEYYESLDNPKESKALTKRIESEIKAYTSEENLRQIERAVDLSSYGIVSEFRKQFPRLNEKDYAMLSLACAGFSAKAVCLFLNLKYKNFFLRRARLIERIHASDAACKERFIHCLSKPYI